jgi:hypothetical protein
MDPITGLAIGKGVIGGIQALVGGGRAGKAQRELEGMVNSYQPNASITDYYNKALQRYSNNPYNSASYQNQMQNVNRNIATGIGGLQDRRSALGGITSLVQAGNDASLRAVAGAEQQGAQALGQLGQATGMKATEDRRKFDMKYNLLALKAGAGNQMMNTGIQNVFGAAGDMANYYTAKEMYGGNGGQEPQVKSSKVFKQIGTNPGGSPHFGYE